MSSYSNPAEPYEFAYGKYGEDENFDIEHQKQYFSTHRYVIRKGRSKFLEVWREYFQTAIYILMNSFQAFPSQIWGIIIIHDFLFLLLAIVFLLFPFLYCMVLSL